MYQFYTFQALRYIYVQPKLKTKEMQSFNKDCAVNIYHANCNDESYNKKETLQITLQAM
jgi:hypothetical protein